MKCYKSLCTSEYIFSISLLLLRKIRRYSSLRRIVRLRHSLCKHISCQCAILSSTLFHILVVSPFFCFIAFYTIFFFQSKTHFWKCDYYFLLFSSVNLSLILSAVAHKSDKKNTMLVAQNSYTSFIFMRELRWAALKFCFKITFGICQFRTC